MTYLRTNKMRARRIPMLLLASAVALSIACDVGSTGPTYTGTYYTLTTDWQDSVSYAAGTTITVPVHVLISGTPVSGASVGWGMLSGNGHISDTLTTTDTLGATHITWTLGLTPQMNTLVVGSGDAVDTLYANGVVGAPSSLAVVGAQSWVVSPDSAVVLQVVVKDRQGNVAPNATVNWTSTGGVLSNLNTTSDSIGVATTTFTASPVGTYQVTADLPNRATCIFEVIVR